MARLQSVLASLACLVAAVAALNPGANFPTITPSLNLNWHACLSGYQCARLDVPLDYALPQGSRASVPLIRLQNSTSPYKGMLLVNPGGPGLSGVDWLLENIDLVKTVAGTNYDIVAFDPRGVGYSIPSAYCPPPAAKNRRSLIFDQNHFSNLIDPFLPDWIATSAPFGSNCNATIGGANQAGPHMTTSVVAKDVVSIIDAFARTSKGKSIPNTKLLNYYGLSYGTVIGQTFASMYPSRVGRVVLDGIMDPSDYVSGDGLHNIQLTDAAFAIFFTYCFKAGPSKCAYATGASSEHDIYLRFQRSMDILNPQLAQTNGWANASAINDALSNVKGGLLLAARQPVDDFSLLSDMLVAVETSLINFDPAIFFNKILPFLGAIAGNLFGFGTPPEWQAGVGCSDTGGVLYGQTIPSTHANTVALQSQSFVAGDLWESNRLACTGWSIKGVERFTGPFTAQTSTPMFLISNILDPITPLLNGVSAVHRFPGSRLLTVFGVGHCSDSVRNTCAWRAMNTYFQTGTFPPLTAAGTLCYSEAGPWGVTLSGGGGLWKRDERIEEGLRGLRMG